MLAANFDSVLKFLFWGHGYTSRYGSIPYAVVTDLMILVALVVAISRRIGRLVKKGNPQDASAAAEKQRITSPFRRPPGQPPS